MNINETQFYERNRRSMKKIEIMMQVSYFLVKREDTYFPWICVEREIIDQMIVPHQNWTAKIKFTRVKGGSVLLLTSEAYELDVNL